MDAGERVIRSEFLFGDPRVAGEEDWKRLERVFKGKEKVYIREREELVIAGGGGGGSGLGMEWSEQGQGDRE